MEINLLEIWKHMGLPVRGVVALLTLQAIACLAVVTDRLLMLMRSRRASSKFAAEVSKQGARVTPEKVLEVALLHPESHLAQHLERGARAWLQFLSSGNRAREAADLTKEVLARKTEPLSRDLYRAMSVLASTGSTAPFVGLLGTVLGIMNAFKMVSATGSGGIGTIGAAISEALIVTGYGLAVAIPTVLLFNWISGRLASYEGDIQDAAGDMIDRFRMNAGMHEPTGEDRVHNSDVAPKHPPRDSNKTKSVGAAS